MKIKQYKERIFVILGFICLFLGFIGALLPVVPTVPFLFIAYFCFKKGSKRFKNWYENSKYHKHYIKSVNRFKAMSLSKKILYIFAMIVFFSCLFYFWYYLYINYSDLAAYYARKLLDFIRCKL
ncbi:MAG: YbaN family protein [Lachnospirales bacterium]